nr:portal protein [Paracoccaceae bacterium]
MGLFDNFKKAEVRSLENPNAPVSAENFFHIMGWGDFQSSAGVTVNIDNALGVPAVWAAVNFISGTLASLPLEVYRGNARVTDGIGAWLNRAINPTTSSFQWRKYSYEQVLTGGRSVTLILRNGRSDVTDLVPLDPADLHVQEQVTAEFPTKTYRSKSRVYQASEVIDLHFMLKHNQIDIRGPVMTNKDIIGLAIAAARYGSKAFQSGGIPPAVLQGPFQSGAAAQRASEDVAATTARLAREGRPVMALPAGHELKSVGFSPEQMQLLELQQFCIEQIARIYSLPPVFLQDLSDGTYSNTEQQDLHFVKHTLRRWIEQSEQEMNLKLFGRESDMEVRFNVDSLLRGDLKTRMEAHATAIQNGIKTPNEVREKEGMQPLPAGDDLMIQGATVPIESQGEGEAVEVS